MAEAAAAVGLWLAVVNGPNLGRLGRREPGIYGTESWEAIQARLERWWRPRGVALEFFQSNHEGRLVDYLEAAADRGCGGVALNPGALTHQSYVLADCLRALPMPVVEVHLSNIFAREDFRARSLTAPAAWGQVSGLGWLGYHLALEALWRRQRPGGEAEA
ncbi:3-dehydroquinate dehydratase, type II [Candidatus Hydrogenisulfobacillus filiaventi]|uniref:3-dehydroquinate dehydratase n=1 Tax=Candidatus Hydrogenisulfobacillus filiaventi TaxID=2707344 RepID=A0A6F8ZGL0_9FIRM|nr:3-dehydroquinate dehydratase [Bacillota bacterium]CAB1128920.1 3-dehydroquinate dehydratase, type II [Candidatus Hydrogenisulfobacillus filiaventi]